MRDSTPSLTTIALGGPHAGQSLTGSYGMCRAYIREPLSVAGFSKDDVPVMAPSRYALYREERLDYTDAKGKTWTFRFWVHVELPESGEALIRELVAGYRPVHVDCND